ncbi:MAG: dienelactone hydrolase family protein [Cuniculiplasma sp.]
MANLQESMKKFEVEDGNELDYFEVKYGESAPKVMVVSEIWGLTKFIKSFSRRVAMEGYNVIAPDLYSSLTFEKRLMSNLMQKCFYTDWNVNY